MTTRLIKAGLVLGALCGHAHAQVRVVTWNISNYNGSNRATDIQNVLYGQVPAGLALAGQRMAPDVLLIQEVSSSAALNTLVSVVNSAPGSPGDWAAAPFINGNDSEGVLLYRTGKFTLVGNTTWTISVGVSASTTEPPRNTYRYDLRPVGYTSAGATLACYNSHMKAQDAGSDDNAMRLTECRRIRDNAQGLDTNPDNGVFDGLPAGYSFILAGDFNIQSSGSAEYQELVASQANNAGRFFDPINSPGSWNNNSAFTFLHTQDPATSAANGGMDDRFDQILVSQSLRDSAGWHYIGSHTLDYSDTTWNDPNHSHRAWGNDGGSGGGMLRVAGNTMVGPVIAQDIIDCASGSGHIPVFADFRVPAKAGVSSVTIDFGAVTQGAPAPQRTLTVTNTGDTALYGAGGIAALHYSLAAAPGFTVPVGSFSDAAGGAGVNHTLAMPTGTLGPRNATLTITTDAPDTPTIQVTLTGNVVPVNAAPSANAGPDQTVTDFDNGGSETVTLDGSASADSDGTIVSYEWLEGATPLAPASATPTLDASLPVGPHTITLRVTDDDGATATDTVLVTVNPWPGCNDLDFNNDGLFPDNQDLEDFLSVFGGGPCLTGDCDTIDFNNDQLFPDNADLEAFFSVFGGGSC
ncbi:MAG TPA: PKD domain-containing protein [Phycisphaerales bacterium]|nr:PKD domain-containing protein [Phycisphaerales bacterium]